MQDGARKPCRKPSNTCHRHYAVRHRRCAKHCRHHDVTASCGEPLRMVVWLFPSLILYPGAAVTLFIIVYYTGLIALFANNYTILSHMYLFDVTLAPLSLLGIPTIARYFACFLGVKCSAVFEKCLLKCRKGIGHSLFIESPRKRRNTCVKC